MASRSKGAQPGNINALKHGFYSSQFSDLELNDLESALGVGLGDEIALLRVLIRRFSTILYSANFDLEEMSLFLNTLGSNMTRLAGLLRADFLISGTSDSSIMQALHGAISDFAKDLRL